MPELPEVETVRRGLAPVFEGARVERLHLARPDLRFPFPDGFAKAVEGREVTALGRRAKYLLADLHDSAYRQHMASKLGLSHADEADEQRYQAFLQLLQDHDSDFTLSFRALRDRAAQIGGLTVNDAIDELFTLPAAFDDWLADWQQRLDQDSMSASERDSIMRRANPVFIPRNHQVEAAIAAAYQGDMEGFITLNRVLSQPFEYRPEWRDYALPAKDEERVDQTFCGT